VGRVVSTLILRGDKNLEEKEWKNSGLYELKQEAKKQKRDFNYLL